MGDENVGLVKSVFEKLREHYPDMAAGVDESLFSKDNRRVFNSAALQDHHALIPLDVLPPDASEQEANVYNLVLKRFFTLFMPDFIYNAVKILVTIAGRLFAGSGIEPIQSGWKTDPGLNDDDGGEPPEILAGLEEKDYPLLSLAAVEKFTEPKKHYTFASLLSLMENPRGEDGARLAGLGTPATRGSILQKLFARKYLAQKGKSILIEPDGIFLVENVRKNEALARFISIPETTRWEEKLHADPKNFVAGVKDFVRNAVKNTSVAAAERPEKASLGKCPLCSADVYEGKKSYYCSNYRPKDGADGNGGNDGCRFAIWKETAGASVSPDDARLLLSGKPTKAKKCKSRAGKEFSASFILKNGKIEFRFQERKLKK